MVYRTPVAAGSCYVFYNNITRGASPEFKAKAAANKRPALETHLSMLRFFVSGECRSVASVKLRMGALALPARALSTVLSQASSPAAWFVPK